MDQLSTFNIQTYELFIEVNLNGFRFDKGFSYMTSKA